MTDERLKLHIYWQNRHWSSEDAIHNKNRFDLSKWFAKILKNFSNLSKLFWTWFLCVILSCCKHMLTYPSRYHIWCTEKPELSKQKIRLVLKSMMFWKILFCLFLKSLAKWNWQLIVFEHLCCIVNFKTNPQQNVYQQNQGLNVVLDTCVALS